MSSSTIIQLLYICRFLHLKKKSIAALSSMKNSLNLVCFFCESVFFIFIFHGLFFYAVLSVPCSLGLTSLLSCVLCFLVCFSLSHMVFRVRYRLLIFAYLPTLHASEKYERGQRSGIDTIRHHT